MPHITITEQKKISKELQEAFCINGRYDYGLFTDGMIAGFVEKFSLTKYLNLNANVPEIWKGEGVQKEQFNFTIQWVKEYLKLFVHDQKALFDYPLNSISYWEGVEHPWMTDHWVKTDVAFETFNPYNCRKLINMMLSIPLDYKDTKEIHREIIKRAGLEFVG